MNVECMALPNCRVGHAANNVNYCIYHFLDAVVVVDKGKCVAIGKPVPLKSVHGNTFPDTHQCILLTGAQDGYHAPYPCGRMDLKENFFFCQGLVLCCATYHAKKAHSK